MTTTTVPSTTGSDRDDIVATITLVAHQLLDLADKIEAAGREGAQR